MQAPHFFPILATLAAAPWLAGASAYAQPAAIGSAEVLAGAGHDSNMLLQIAPDPATTTPLASGWFGRVAPALAGALAWPEWRLGLSYKLDYRGSEAAGSMLQHEGELSLALPALGALHTWLSLSVGSFNAYRFPEEDFWLAGGSLGLRLEITSALRLSVTYRLDRRSATDATLASTAWLHQADGSLIYRPSALVAVGLASSYLRMDVPPAEGGGAFSTLRAGPDVKIQWGRLEARLAVWGGLLDDPAARVRDAQIGVSTGWLARITSNLDGFASFDWVTSVTTTGLATDPYARRVFLAGLVGHITGKFTSGSSGAAELRPLLQDGRVRLRAHVEQASEVRVMGSWDAWAASTPLHATGQTGLWEVWLDLPRGLYRYRLVVDGKAVAPSDSAPTLPDDFGERDAVLEVSEGQGVP